MGAGFFGGLLNNTIAPSINRLTAGSNLGTIGANTIGSAIGMPGQQTPQQKVDQSRQGGGILKMRQPQPTPEFNIEPGMGAPGPGNILDHLFGQGNQPGTIGIDLSPGHYLPIAPGFNMPQNPNQGGQQNQQYFQQMHQNMDGMNEALKQIEGMQMPGGRYDGGKSIGGKGDIGGKFTSPMFGGINTGAPGQGQFNPTGGAPDYRTFNV